MVKIKAELIDKYPDSKFDKKQLKIGTKIEMEHTKDELVAKKIAKDHLMEFQNYYKELKKMENKLKRQKEKPIQKRRGLM